MPTIDGGGRDQRIKEALEKKVICRRCQVEMVPNPHFLTIWAQFPHRDPVLPEVRRGISAGSAGKRAYGGCGERAGR